ncbi:unnamed protein product [Ilex paraguariensis]|uniref:O-acyltransferase WSD1 C-terminal domain-containing protein n=1 Tax=Ilex paraguariensis TaxID=185542 RepID=A0ABC8TQ52_9AQUA
MTPTPWGSPPTHDYYCGTPYLGDQGQTINDVITGIIFFGTRLYMQSTSNASGEADSTALVVLNTRAVGGYKSVSEMLKPDAKMLWGNQLTFLHIPIPNLTVAESSDPLNFIWKAHQLIKRKRNSFAFHLTSMFLETLRRLRGPQAASWYVYNSFKNTSTVISNLIGPVEKLALANHPVSGMYYTVVGSPQDLTITMVSYMGKLWVAMAMEKSFINSHKLKACIEDAYEMVLKTAIQKSSPQGAAGN